MLSYAFQVLQEQSYRNLATEGFHNVAELYAAILSRGISTQLKRGLGRDYIDKSEPLSTLQGRLDISESIKTQTMLKKQMVCTYDEFSVNTEMNRIIKSTVLLLLKAGIDRKRKKELRNLLLFFSEVDEVDLHISFMDSSGFLFQEENYKSELAEKAREVLRCKDWEKSWIGTGKIAQCAVKAIAEANNLVNSNQKIGFKDRLDPSRAEFVPEAEQALYDIYCGNNDQSAFEAAVSAFGAKYDTIAFLFFIKDDTRFLPISARNFDQSLEYLNIDLRTERRCSWKNYMDFIDVVSAVRDEMDIAMPLQTRARLIDAHSFLWILHQKRFLEFEPDTEASQEMEEATEAYLLNAAAEGSGRRHVTTSQTWARSSEVVRISRERANGICQLCGNPAPFNDRNGRPYLEVHHVIWLTNGGKDSTENTVALCPNCHRKMHIVDDPADLERLKQQLTH